MASLNQASDQKSRWKVERERALQPFRHAGSLESPKLFDQRGRLSIDANGTAMRGRQKSGFDHVVDEAKERREEARDIEKSDRFVDFGQLVHRPDFHQFLDGADTAGHRDEGVGKIGHPLLTGAQSSDDLMPGQSDMRVPALMQRRSVMMP